MVKWFIVLLTFAYSLAMADEDVKISASIDESKGWVGKPVKGTIQIQHDSSQKIDTGSFTIGGKPLEVELYNELLVRPGQSLMITQYKFTITPQEKGLQVLPQISANIGGKTYKSAPSTYEVAEESAPAAATGGQAKKGSFLKLEAEVQGGPSLYPGQRARFIYRYLFNDNIELTKEDLPLLDAQGFTKIGEKLVKDAEKGAYDIREISQEVEASIPGDYSYGPSVIEGYIYKQDAMGRREYFKPKLTSEAPAIAVKVLPFPSQGKPASFNGAIGSFTDFKVRLISYPKVNAGDKLSLEITITGAGSLESTPMPDLCCQPGFPGMFRLSDLPPAGVVKNGSKQFVAELRPLSGVIKEIPSIEFSWFDPKTQKYSSLQSAPIPIQVAALPVSQNAQPLPNQGGDWPKFSNTPQPIEIESIMSLSNRDLNNLPFGTWFSLLIIPYGFGALLLQIGWKKYLQDKAKIILPPNSQDFFAMAEKAPLGSSEFFELLQKAFLMRLQEKGHIISSEINPERLPKIGIPGQVRDFLRSIDEKRFTGSKKEFNLETLKEAKKLFNKI